MQITDVRLRKVNSENRMKAVASVTFDNEFVSSRYQSYRKPKWIIHSYAKQKNSKRRIQRYSSSNQC